MLKTTGRTNSYFNRALEGGRSVHRAGSRAPRITAAATRPSRRRRLPKTPLTLGRTDCKNRELLIKFIALAGRAFRLTFSAHDRLEMLLTFPANVFVDGHRRVPL